MNEEIGRYELSEETTIILQSDGSLIMEVMVDDDLAAVLLTAPEVERLRTILNAEQARP